MSDKVSADAAIAAVKTVAEAATEAIEAAGTNDEMAIEQAVERAENAEQVAETMADALARTATFARIEGIEKWQAGADRELSEVKQSLLAIQASLSELAAATVVASTAKPSLILEPSEPVTEPLPVAKPEENFPSVEEESPAARRKRTRHWI